MLKNHNFFSPFSLQDMAAQEGRTEDAKKYANELDELEERAIELDRQRNKNVNAIT